jgi:hypothetical protein
MTVCIYVNKGVIITNVNDIFCVIQQVERKLPYSFRKWLINNEFFFIRTGFNSMGKKLRIPNTEIIVWDTSCKTNDYFSIEFHY